MVEVEPVALRMEGAFVDEMLRCEELVVVRVCNDAGIDRGMLFIFVWKRVDNVQSLCRWRINKELLGDGRDCRVWRQWTKSVHDKIRHLQDLCSGKVCPRQC
jgi:hypothetical protein